MIQPMTLDEFNSLAKKDSRIAYFQEIPAEKLTPFTIYSQLNQFLSQDGAMLEDLYQRNTARFSYICFQPLVTLMINNANDKQPMPALREMQAKMHYVTRASVAELITSAIGFITYDVVRYFEKIPDRHTADPGLPILLFNFYQLSVTFDHTRQTVLISTLVDIDDQPEQAYQQAKEKIESVIKILENVPDETDFTTEMKSPSKIDIDTSDQDFMQSVEKAKKYILQGDAFQIVLSRCFRRQYSVSPLQIYKTMRRVTPAPFMFYFPTEKYCIVGASPERFIRVDNKQVTVNPIAGTRKRISETTDSEIENDLLNDKKELAEHMMLVDLARNDVGAVSEAGTVNVKELLQVKHYSHISHITSTVTGKLKEKCDAFDAFAAAFPAGTLSGAPKIRAMEIIDELETSRRGLYGGAICRLDLSANFDSCIAIRMAVLKDGIATIRTGAGIVYDSNPASEAQETHQKARSMLDAIAQAHGE